MGGRRELRDESCEGRKKEGGLEEAAARVTERAPGPAGFLKRLFCAFQNILLRAGLPLLGWAGMAWHGPALLVWVASAELGRDGICGPACDLFVFLIIEQDRKRREQNGTESKESSAAAASIKGRASAVVRALLRRQTTRRRPLPRRPSNVFADKVIIPFAPLALARILARFGGSGGVPPPPSGFSAWPPALSPFLPRFV